MKRKIVRIFIYFVYLWCCIWYDKKYLVGENFNREHFSNGWKKALRCWFPQKVLGYARNIPFPISKNVMIVNYNNITFSSDDISNFFSPGCFYQATKGKIYIGHGTMIAPNCGIITTNHDLNDLKKHVDGKDVKLGENCWIGMNSIILPGVELDDKTIVGAGSVVTKSFIEGNCVIAGNPARKIKDL